MDITKLSTKGQVVLPKSIRHAHHWEAGVEFSVEDTAEGILLRPHKPFNPTNWDAVVGCLQHHGAAKSLDEMEKAIRKGVKNRHDRDRY